MKPWLRLAAFVALAAGFLLWWYAPSRVIERRTRALLEIITIPASAGKAARLVRPESLTPYLGETVRFTTPADEVNGDLDLPDITAGFGHVAATAGETRFRMVEKRSIEVQGDSATIRFLLDAYADMPSHRSSNGLHETSIEWLKTKDGWRVSAVEVAPPAEP